MRGPTILALTVGERFILLLNDKQRTCSDFGEQGPKLGWEEGPAVLSELLVHGHLVKTGDTPLFLMTAAETMLHVDLKTG